MKFSELNISKNLLENLNSLGYENLTAIQEKSLKHSLNGSDLVGKAKTGSGKTLSFCLPIVEKLDVKKFRVQALILAPTRELANQIAIEQRRVFRHIHNIKVLTLGGGVPFKPQVASLSHQAHIIVGTVGRVLKHLQEGHLNLENLHTFVLDEADKMLDMGFYDDILKIIEYLPKTRQTMLFSATYEDNIKNLSKELLNNPIFVEVENEEKAKINQIFYEIDENSEKEEKLDLIEKLIKKYKAQSTIIFCNQKITCDELNDSLYNRYIDSLVMHSDLEQKDRDETLAIFSNKSYPILIASDVASRGIDIDDIDLVINYEVALNEKIHTHRIGRTARAGKGGNAITFYTKNEEERVENIKNNFSDIAFEDKNRIEFDDKYEIDSPYRTIFINGGKKQKLRKADILGSLTAGLGLNKDEIGKIDSFDFCSYVAICKEKIEYVINNLPKSKIKGKYYRIFEK